MTVCIRPSGTSTHIAALQTLNMLGHSHAACALAVHVCNTAQLRQMSGDSALVRPKVCTAHAEVGSAVVCLHIAAPDYAQLRLAAFNPGGLRLGSVMRGLLKRH